MMSQTDDNHSEQGDGDGRTKDIPSDDSHAMVSNSEEDSDDSFGIKEYNSNEDLQKSLKRCSQRSEVRLSVIQPLSLDIINCLY